MGTLFTVLGVVFIIYCVLLFLLGGYGTKFFLIWAVLGVVCIVWAKCGKKILSHLPKWIRKAFYSCVAVGLTVFVVVEGLIISGFFVKAPADLDYLVVLGAQLKANGPSYVLQMRLDAAYEYLVANEATKVIVSGGQGSNEPDTEAQGMYDYLVGRGISAERIIKEDMSTDTSENISFSMQFLDAENDSVGIVSNNFHIFRATHLAEAAGYAEVYGLPARSHIGYLPNNMFREFFGILKDLLMGNLT